MSDRTFSSKSLYALLPFASAALLACGGAASSGDPSSPLDAGHVGETDGASGVPPTGDSGPDDSAAGPLPDATVSTDAGTRPPVDAGTPDAWPPPTYDGGLDPDAGLVLIGCDGLTDGTIGARFMGIPAYCQNYSGTRYYQCDELGNRFVRDAFGHPAITNVATDSATIICRAAAKMPAYSVWGPKYRATAGHAPVPGDLVVWSSGVGHVVVVTSIGTGQVSYMQQNDGDPTGTTAWDPARSFFIDKGIDCWIHAEPIAPQPPSPQKDCGCFEGDGDYCGLAIVDHEAWYDCDARVEGNVVDYATLYACTGGVFRAKTACANCYTELLSPAVGKCM